MFDVSQQLSELVTSAVGYLRMELEWHLVIFCTANITLSCVYFYLFIHFSNM